MNKKVFTVNVDGNDVELAVLKPSADIRISAQLHYNKAWRQSVESGSILLRNLDSVAEEQGIWDAEKRRQVEDLEKQILASERQLMGGANNFASLDDAKKCALEIRALRNKRLDVLRSKNELYQYTAESFADDVRVKYFVSQCTIYNDSGAKYFKSYEDFLNQVDSEVAVKAMTNYFELMYADFDTGEKDLYENKFLLKYGMVDDKFRLIDPVHRWLIDPETGKRIDEQGRYLTDDGQYCDRNGLLVNEDGSYLVPFKEFE